MGSRQDQKASDSRLPASVALTIAAASLLAVHASADDFGKGSPENKPPEYTDEYIQNQILKQLKIVCQNGACVLASVTSSGHRFNVQLTGGYGYNGLIAPTNGGIVISNPQANGNMAPQPYIGLTAAYTQSSCTQTVLVPESLYISMNTYLYKLIKQDGSTERTFTPSEQTMILFYTTILGQAKGCTIN